MLTIQFRIEGLCTRMERQQERLLAALADWPQEEAAFRPSSEAWSATEVLSHIMKVERGTARSVERAMAAPAGRVTVDDRARAYRLIHWLYSPRRVEVPKAEAGGIWPDAEPRLKESAAQWRSARQAMLALARQCGDEAEDRCVFVHPGSGSMNMLLVLRFLHAHTRHHEHQLDRLREAAQHLRT